MFKRWFVFFSTVVFFVSGLQATSKLQDLYNFQKALSVSVSDIGEHLPILCEIASQCESVIEIGLREMVSTYGILQGLSQNHSERKLYIGIDIVAPSKGLAKIMRQLARENGIAFRIWQANDLFIDIPPTEFLFIDSLHTYCHLTYELDRFSPQVSKYIAMHDTSEPWGDRDDNEYYGNYSEYPPFINREKRGLWPAVEDFLHNHPEWVLESRYLNCHGFTILKRIK